MVRYAIHSKFRKARLKTTLKFLGVLFIVLLVTIFQDFLHARFNTYSFYLSESFLFNLFWVLVIPIGLALKKSFQKLPLLKSLQGKLSGTAVFTIAGSMLHILAYALLVFGVSAVFYSHTFGFIGNLGYTLSHDLYKYLLVYAAISILILRKKQKGNEANTTPAFSEQLVISSGRSHLILTTAQIVYIQTSTPYIEIHTLDKKHLHSETLKSILGRLDPALFVRIHKSTIVNLDQVSSYKSRLNGDYDVHLKTGVVLRLSRNYVADFRKLQNQTPQLRS